MPTPAEITARILLETQAVLFRIDPPFTFTSGRKSPVYTDCRRLISFPRERKVLMQLAHEHLEREIGLQNIDVIAGGETAGIPFAAWIAAGADLPMVYVRKQPKGFGRNAQIEGTFKEGARVLLVEDLASEGTSKLNFVNALRTADALCHHCFVVFHYGIFSDAPLKDASITLHALATWHDVLKLAKEKNYFEKPVLEAVEAFLAAPDAWQPAA